MRNSAMFSKYQSQLTIHSNHTIEQSTKGTTTPCHSEEHFFRRKKDGVQGNHSLGHKNAKVQNGVYGI